MHEEACNRSECNRSGMSYLSCRTGSTTGARAFFMEIDKTKQRLLQVASEQR